VEAWLVVAVVVNLCREHCGDNKVET